jgi:hypothetical protein
MLNLSNNEFNIIIIVALHVRNYSDFVYFKKYILNRLNNTYIRHVTSLIFPENLISENTIYMMLFLHIV